MSVRRFPKLSRDGLIAIVVSACIGVHIAITNELLAATDQTTTMTLKGASVPGFGIDGYKSWDLQWRDSQATTGENAQAEISDMLLRIFSGGKNSSLEMSITSARAHLVTSNSDARASETQVSGTDTLYITGANDSYKVTGNDWSWNSNTHIINLGRNVFVTFQSSAAGNSTLATKPAHPIIIMSDKLKITQLATINQFDFSGNISIAEQDAKAEPNDEFHTTCSELEVLATRAASPATHDASTTRSGATATPVANLAVGSIQSIVATNNVVSRQGAIEARSGEANISPENNQIVLFNSPQIRMELSGNTTETTNYALIEGRRINWLRDQQEMTVEPTIETDGTPGRVKVTLPSNSPPSPGESAAQTVITGESLHAQYSLQQRRFDIEKSVRVEDPKYTIEAQHLDAEFDPPAPEADKPTPILDDKTLMSGKTTPQLGKLNHLAVNGGVTLFQSNLQATTPQAEVLPSDEIIVLSGGPHVEDTLSNVTIDASTIKLATDGNHANVLGEEGKPAHVKLPSLPLGENGMTNVETDILSKSVVMDRGNEYSNFTFSENVQVNASSMELSSGQLDATTYNVPTSTESDPVKRVQIERLVARDHVSLSEPGFKAQAAVAEVNPQTGLAQNATNPTPATETREYRLIQLHGDPSGATGPVRPEVEVLLPDMNPSNPAPGKTAASNDTTAKITSDEQWLLTSPMENTYVFTGNVSADVGSAGARLFLATSELMQVNCTQEKTTDINTPNAGVPHLGVDDIVAERNVRIVQNDPDQQTSTADRAVITPQENKAVLSGNAVVSDNKGMRVQYGDIILRLIGNKLSESIETPPPSARGQPIQRPTITLPASALHLDSLKKNTEKDSNPPTR